MIKICRALDFNFLALYCVFPTNVYAYLAAVALGDGDAFNSIADVALLAQLEVMKEKVTGLEDSRANLKDTIEQLKARLQDNEEMIQMLRTSKQ